MSAFANGAPIPDTHHLIPRALAWAGGTTGLDDLCDHLMDAAELSHDRAAVRIAASLLVVNHKRLPALQDAVCEFALALVLDDERDARTHLLNADDLLIGVEQNLDWMRVQYGLLDRRVEALRQRVEDLFDRQDERREAVARGAELDARGEAVVGGDVGGAATVRGSIEMGVRSSRLDGSERGGEVATGSTACHRRSALVNVPVRGRTKRSTIDLTSSSPDEPLITRYPKRAKPDNPTKTATKQTVSPTKTSRKQTDNPTKTVVKQAIPVPATDSVTITSFYAVSTRVTSGGTLTYDSTQDSFYVSASPTTKIWARLGRREISRVYYGTDSKRVYITGAVTPASNGRICIAFKGVAGVQWFLGKVRVMSGDQVALQYLQVKRLDEVFSKQCAEIAEAYAKRQVGAGMAGGDIIMG
ncbi:hypothetical protein LTR02_004477 [Friedmanniomyces endolithicus]|uniref:Uncharacterized protein n=1 Tax=Friedmanniomyces endolithicus TaxID=329885 RepID=A0A4U0VJU3_9PEZI|nr:hypothetical protein LTS09_002594 [Friedmanniomyces endolithicus]KAK0355936.1 hypothetical protein LTR94_006512 [Friedmanniomyces endolithicus]KAK0798923.1 hypothetical protein LTR38_007729 [Friedmanniomyces endolithicus]KAK0803447.1 hypothetical protein LTR59_004654 [Friedmanniomyces endolithicus]KAK0821668.1 hypothetical protein LTR75_000325 [Friedmanniomyces endolithicus]